VSYIAGLLIDGLDGVPDHDVIAGEGDLFFVMFHQGGVGLGPTCAPASRASTASRDAEPPNGSSPPARCPATPGASRSSPRYRPDPVPPIRVTTRGPLSPTSTASC